MRQGVYGSPPTWLIFAVIGLLALPSSIVFGLLGVLAWRRVFGPDTKGGMPAH